MKPATTERYAQFQAEVARRRPCVALILGSGLSGLAETLRESLAIRFLEVPGMPSASVPGHRGELVLGWWGDCSVLVFAGRVHFYEGHPWRNVLRPVQVAAELGCKVLLATNAAGGIRDDLNPGDLLAIHDHLEWTYPYFWRRAWPQVRLRSEAKAVGNSIAEFTSVSRPSPYAPELTDLLQRGAQNLGFTIPTGIYAQLTGPNYETPAEIRALRTLGADAVGMSTAREIQMGFDLGMKCAGLSCITNKAAGLSKAPIHHGEVMDVAAMVRDRMIGVLDLFLRETAT